MDGLRSVVLPEQSPLMRVLTQVHFRGQGRLPQPVVSLFYDCMTRQTAEGLTALPQKTFFLFLLQIFSDLICMNQKNMHSACDIMDLNINFATANGHRAP